MRKHAPLGWAAFGLSVWMLLGGAAMARADQDSDAKGWLGIYSQTLTSELRDGIDYQGDGVLVTRVVEGSPAESAGIEKGDVIVSVNSRAVDSPEALADVIGTKSLGDEVSIRLVRDGEHRTVRVRLAARPGDDSMQSAPKHAPDEMGAPEAPTPPTPPDMDQMHSEIHRFMRDNPDMVRMAVSRGRLGVRVKDPEQGDRGAEVTEVIDDSPAAKSGIRKGDVILKVDDSSIDDSADLIRTLRGKQGHVSIEVDRDGSRHTFDIELAGPVRMYRFHQNLDDNGGPSAGANPGDASSSELQREIVDLKDQIRQLRRELEELKREK